jgi:hypothetical protein
MVMFLLWAYEAAFQSGNGNLTQKLGRGASHELFGTDGSGRHRNSGALADVLQTDPSTSGQDLMAME